MKSEVNTRFRTKPLEPKSGEYLGTVDDIHGSIKFCPVIKAFVDTPQFQRLRELKQLGVCSYVYVNAVHTRFEHSLGVAHLAEEMLRGIQRRQPQLGITEKEILCVKIAGLCHDLGHGPFSHVYDGQFMKLMEENDKTFKKTAHEFTSLMMFDQCLLHLGLKIDLNRLDEPLQQVGDGISSAYFGVCGPEYDVAEPLKDGNVFTSRDMVFIKECILGSSLKGDKDYIGVKNKTKVFLYDVVNNKYSGLDVDKIDYFARDKKRGECKGHDLDLKILNEAFVAYGSYPSSNDCYSCRMGKHNSSSQLNENEKMQPMIAFPDKMAPYAMSFFKTRFDLFSTVYTHKTAKAAEYLLCDILLAANDHFLIPNESHADNKNEPSHVKISDAVHYPKAFLLLTDSIISNIRLSTSPELDKARKLIDRLYSRKFYKCAITQNIRMNNRKEASWFDKTEQEIVDLLIGTKGFHRSQETNRLVTLQQKDLIVEKRSIHYGMGKENPVNRMRFVPKWNLYKLKENVADLPLAVSINENTYESHIPRAFLQNSLRIYVRSGEPDQIDLVRHIFESLWANENQPQTIESPYASKRIPQLSQDSIDSVEGEKKCSSRLSVSFNNNSVVRELYEGTDGDLEVIPSTKKFRIV